MWLVILAVWLAGGAALGVYVGVRQRRHPPSVGPARVKLGNADPDNRDCPWSF